MEELKAKEFKTKPDAGGITFEDTRETRTRRVKVGTIEEAQELFGRIGAFPVEDPGLRNEVTDAVLEDVVWEGDEMPTATMTHGQKVANTSRMLLATSGALLTSSPEAQVILPADEKGQSAFVLHMTPVEGRLSVETETIGECAAQLFNVSQATLEEFISRTKGKMSEQMTVLKDTYKERKEDVLKKSKSKIPLLLLAPESLIPVRVKGDETHIEFSMRVMDDTRAQRAP